MEEDFEIMPNLLDRRRLKDRIIENISKAVKNVRFRLTFQELIPLTHGPETGARNWRQKLASVSGASFSRQLQNFWRQKPTRTNKK